MKTAVQLLLPEMDGTAGFYEARTDRHPDPRAGLRRPALQPLPATVAARQAPQRTRDAAAGLFA